MEVKGWTVTKGEEGKSKGMDSVGKEKIMVA